jgi:hypothetical protein
MVGMVEVRQNISDILFKTSDIRHTQDLHQTEDELQSSQ